jgi:tetratricopeptide (TPR) repeat protein
MPTEILDEDKPLSKCALWPLQVEYFRACGIAAWETVPFHATSNPFIADVYAELLIGWLLEARPTLDLAEPVYMVEIGAGTGRFSFHLLRELHAKKTRFKALDEVRVVHVVTDVPEENVAFSEKHDRLDVFRASGAVDFAVFDPTREDAIRLRLSGTTLAPGSTKNPVVLIANYVFDSLHMDLFRVAEGKLQEVRVKVARERKNGARPPATPAEKASLDDVVLTESYHDVPTGYYGDEALDAILAHYVESFDEASILFPIGAFRAIRRLEAIAGGRLVVISSDKGFTHGGYMEGHFEHPVSHHGSFSYMMNYHALRRYGERRGGLALATEDASLFLQTVMLVLEEGASSRYDLLRYFFAETLGGKNLPCDLYQLPNFLPDTESPTPKERLERALSLVRVCHWDPSTLRRAQSQIVDAYTEMSAQAEEDGVVASQQEELKGALLEMNDRVRDRLHPINLNDRDDVNAVGAIYYALERYPACKEVFERSLQMWGPCSYAYYYLASIAEVEEEYPRSLEYYEKALEIEPTCPLTQAGVKRMKVRTRRV